MNTYSVTAGIALLLQGLIVFSAQAEDSVDPFRWLEDIDGQRSTEWVSEENQRTQEALADTALYRDLYNQSLTLLNSKDRLPDIQQKDDWIYALIKNAEHPRGLYRRSKVSDFNAHKEKWQAILDVDKLSASEKTQWVFKGMSCEDKAHERCMLLLSPGGGDAIVGREFNAAKARFVEGGFYIPEAKFSVNWEDENHLLLAISEEDQLTESGYPRQVYRWTRATPLAKAEKLLEVSPKSVSAGVFTLGEGDSRWTLLYDSTTFWTGRYYRLVGDKKFELQLPDSVAIEGAYKDRLVVQLNEDWQRKDKTYPQGSVLAASEAAINGGEPLEVLFEPTASSVVDEVHVGDSGVMLQLLDNVRSKVYFLTPGKDGWQRQALAFPDNGTVHFLTGNMESGEGYFSYENFVTPPTLYHLAAGSGKLSEIQKQKQSFDGDRFVVEQFRVASKDGTLIPYYVVRDKKLKFDGKNPTHMFSYGGFRVSLVPSYSGSYEHLNGAYGKLWLERGGVFVLANIRGGGEFGPAWHAAALRENRHKAYEDFEAIAEDLVKRKISSRDYLSIEGRSNGGLLVGATMTRRPDLYNAVICGVPLADMKHYHTLLAGASWMQEYGDPATDDWNYMKLWSPYQNLKKGVDYPSVFFFTSTRDDRVHPGHARKMAAKMKALGQDYFYYENTEGGHGGSSTNEQLAHRVALQFTHLWLALPGAGKDRAAGAK